MHEAMWCSVLSGDVAERTIFWEQILELCRKFRKEVIELRDEGQGDLALDFLSERKGERTKERGITWFASVDKHDLSIGVHCKVTPKNAPRKKDRNSKIHQN
jgi:hypothetical protein